MVLLARPAAARDHAPWVTSTLSTTGAASGAWPRSSTHPARPALRSRRRGKRRRGNPASPKTARQTHPQRKQRSRRDRRWRGTSTAPLGPCVCGFARAFLGDAPPLNTRPTATLPVGLGPSEEGHAAKRLISTHYNTKKPCGARRAWRGRGRLWCTGWGEGTHQREPCQPNRRREEDTRRRRRYSMRGACDTVTAYIWRSCVASVPQFASSTRSAPQRARSDPSSSPLPPPGHAVPLAFSVSRAQIGEIGDASQRMMNFKWIKCT